MALGWNPTRGHIGARQVLSPLYPAPHSHSYVCLSVCLSVCLPVCLSACLSVCLSTCLSVCLPVCLSACLPLCLSVWSIILFMLTFACVSWVTSLSSHHALSLSAELTASPYHQTKTDRQQVTYVASHFGITLVIMINKIFI